MSTQYRLVQSGKTASGGCSAGQGSSEPVAPRIYFFIYFLFYSPVNPIYYYYYYIIIIIIRQNFKHIQMMA
jgi:hypothetical protein